MCAPALVLAAFAAALPVSDPLSTVPSWSVQSDQPLTLLGISVATAGDVDGDGFDDVLVGASGFDEPGATNTGRAFLYAGSASGLATTPTVLRTGAPGAFLGYAVAPAGDVDGDGFDDVLVSAFGQGAVHVYAGSASGLSTTPSTILRGQPGTSFGVSVSSAGDVDGDGFDDVLVGASGFSAGDGYQGRAHLHRGSAGGLSATASWTATGTYDANLGHSVAAAGDVNGDGFDDVIVGAPLATNGQVSEGQVFVHFGSASGLSVAPSWSAESNQALANFGISVAGAGDVNGDGYDDVLVGAFGYDAGQSNEGRAFLYFGGASGLSASAGWTVESNVANALLGGSVRGAGDVDGDGFDDVILGARGGSEARVYLGAAGGPSSPPAWIVASAATDQFGSSVSSAGDVDGNGSSDVIVGAPQFDGPENDEGAAYVYLGNAGFTAFCFGDGSATACPCGNVGAAGNGCAHSFNPAGANLSATGTASLASDSLTLVGTGMPDNYALYFQGTTQQNGGAGTVFGDGLRCAGGAVLRLETKINTAGASQYPGAGDPSISVRGAITASGTRTYQSWYRNAAAFCTPASFNLTNGLSVSWTP